MSHPVPTNERRPANRREEGAILVIVVLILLVVTATGTYAVHASTSELQGAGATRTAYQTEEMAISMVDGAMDWVDLVGPSTLYRHATLNDRTAVAAGNTSGLQLGNLEPAILAGQLADRLYVQDLASRPGGTASSVLLVSAASLNNGVPQTAAAVVDVYDIHRYPGVTPGARADGYGTLYYLRATYTGRARTELSTLDSSVAQDIRDRQISTSTARAIGTSGPFSM